MNIQIAHSYAFLLTSWMDYKSERIKKKDKKFIPIIYLDFNDTQ